MNGRTKSVGGHGYIPVEWAVVPLPEVVFFQEGPGLRKWQWTDSGMKVINVTNILGDGQIDTSNTDRYISMEEFSKLYSHFAVDDGDIVIASSGNTYGKIGRISAKDLPVMMNTSVIRFRTCNADRLDCDFLYAFLRSEMFRTQVESFVIGSAQPNFGPSHLKRMVMPLPPRPVQRRIAGILSAYDELIENSQRRIRILEAMARSIYREWFVHFRFPGHETHLRVASPLGEIPKGWEVTTFGEIYNTSSGGTPSRKRPEYFDGGSIDWVKSQELLDGFILSTGERITPEALENSSAKVFPANTVLIALYGATIGMLGILAGEAASNQACCAVLPKLPGFGREFAFLALLTNRERIVGLRLGAAQQNISQVLLRNFECVKPPSAIAAQFAKRTAPLFDGILTLQRQIQNLSRTRDLLLPRLMAGRVELESKEN